MSSLVHTTFLGAPIFFSLYLLANYWTYYLIWSGSGCSLTLITLVHVGSTIDFCLRFLCYDRVNIVGWFQSNVSKQTTWTTSFHSINSQCKSRRRPLHGLPDQMNRETYYNSGKLFLPHKVYWHRSQQSVLWQVFQDSSNLSTKQCTVKNEHETSRRNLNHVE